MEAKPFYQSKTFYFNLITGVLAFLSLTEFQSLIPPTWAGPIALVNAVGNMILRLYFTNGPLTGTQATANVMNMAKVMMIAIGLSSLVACSVSQRHQAVIADTAIYTGLAAFQDGEKALYDAGKLDSDPVKNKAKHQAINVVLVKALKSGDALNRTVRGWTPGTATPPELAQHVNDLSALAKTIADNFTDGATKSQLEAWLLTANTAALTIITIATGR